jgi:hypothetical protein
MFAVYVIYELKRLIQKGKCARFPPIGEMVMPVAEINAKPIAVLIDICARGKPHRFPSARPWHFRAPCIVIAPGLHNVRCEFRVLNQESMQAFFRESGECK